MKYEMERHVLNELLAQHHESGWREGYEQCRREMTEECDKRIREAERHGGLADVGDRRDEPIPRGRHLRMGRPHEVVITDELRKWAEEFWEFAYSKFGDQAELLAIADRIDAEHRRRIADVGRAACNAVREVCGS